MPFRFPDPRSFDSNVPIGPVMEPAPTVARPSRRAVLGGLVAAPVLGAALPGMLRGAAAAQEATPAGTPPGTPFADATPVGSPMPAMMAADAPPAAAALAAAGPDDLASERPFGDLELVATVDGPILVGVALSASGRMFLSFPRWGDPVEFTVAEVRDGQVVPYPNAEINQLDRGRPADTFVSVQAIGFDAQDRLWILDTGSVNFGPVIPDGPKLVAIDLATDQVAQTIPFPPDVVLEMSSINDVRFDLRRGEAGMAFITDASMMGPNGIITVDLGTGASWRRLNDHPSTQAEPNFLPLVEGRPLMVRPPGEPPMPITLGADGIAINEDGSRLFYSPLASRHLYSVSVDALADELPEDDVAATVIDHGNKGSASDGFEHDADGNLYLTAYEHNAIIRRTPDGMYETIVQDPRVLWPDTMALAGDGYLYFTANQLHRQPTYQGGQDLRQRPYPIFRVLVNAQPVRLA